VPGSRHVGQRGKFLLQKDSLNVRFELIACGNAFPEARKLKADGSATRCGTDGGVVAESSYDVRMSDNVFDIGTHRPLEALLRELGGLHECRRLGFVFEDENKIMSLSHAGMGYLCFVKAAGITGVAEAYAAGYQCAAEEYEAKLGKV
jgi:hypothetical protein